MTGAESPPTPDGALTTSGGSVYVEREPPVARIVLNRPDQRNAITRELRDDLAEAFAMVAGDDEICAVVLKGNGPALCAGGDLKQLKELRDADATEDLEYTLGIGQEFYRVLWQFPKPIILKAHGHVIGGGMSLVAGADLVVAQEDALFGFPEARSWGFDAYLGFWMLTLGARWFKAMLYTGDSIDGRKAAELGMVNYAVPLERLDEQVEWLALRVAKTDRRILSIQKRAANSMWEILGIEPMMRAAMTHNHLSHRSEPAREFLDRIIEVGPRAAVSERDEPFGGPQRIGDPLPLLEGPPGMCSPTD